MAALLVIFLLCCTLTAYPFLIYPSILRLFPTKNITPQKNMKTSATLLFCAYNEESSLPSKIDNLKKLKKRYPSLEIMAYDDCSSDRTSELLREEPYLLRLFSGTKRMGKAHGMKIMVSQCSNDILIFTDANVLLKLDSIENLLKYFGDTEVGGVCGSLKYLGEGESTTANVGSRYWRMEERLKFEESRTGNVMGADGSIFSIRRVLYPEFPDTVLDDLTVSMAVIFSEKRLIKAEDVIAYERLVVDRSEDLARRVRIATRSYHTHLFLCKDLANLQIFDKFKYFSHRVIRWHGGGFLMIGVLSLSLWAIMFNTYVAAVVILGMALLFFGGLLQKRGPLASGSEIFLSLLATQLGVFRAKRGQTKTVWNPAKSR